MVNINSEVIVERIQKDGVNTIIIAAVIAILSWIFNMYHKSANKYRDQKDQQFREARATFYNVPLVKTQMKKIIVTAKTLYSHPKNVSKIYAALHTDLAW